ncbi:DUF930 domain-containing protein [Brucella sp. IR073]|uniref:DUF930 domain-containing protein n=1 Tax=unclassified Brucella TaxID=2632610 RepID=UPI003B9874F6
MPPQPVPPEPATPVQELAAPPKSPELPAPAAQTAPEPPPIIRATNLYSARMLADPRSRQAREALAQLAGPDRMEQLCDAEAMEQIARWRREFQPDRLIAYAMDDTRLDGALVIADGAAFRSKGRWYQIKFRCGLTADLKTVASFEFQVGDPIPREQWAAHYLSVDDDGE